jgi:hypothetical protein
MILVNKYRHNLKLKRNEKSTNYLPVYLYNGLDTD